LVTIDSIYASRCALGSFREGTNAGLGIARESLMNNNKSETLPDATSDRTWTDAL
jgi:hypothetical protein